MNEIFCGIASEQVLPRPGRTASRLIPLFPELRKPLLDAFTEAEPGAEYVITRYRRPNSNLRTHFQRIIRRAGLEPWPKLFHNLRSTRQTELAESLPAHVVCAWLGNTEDIAKAHYLQVTDAHFTQAIGNVGKAAQNPAQYGAVSSRTIQNEGDVGNSDPARSSTSNDSATEPYDTVRNDTWHTVSPCNTKGWPLSESNRYALAGGGF
jgi:hypothetical protein